MTEPVVKVKQLDVIEFLRTKLTRPETPFFYPNAWRRKVMWRLLGFKLCMAGKITGRDAVRNLVLPQSLKRDVDVKIMGEMRRTVDTIFRDNGFLDGSGMVLAGHPFYPEPDSDPLQSWFWSLTLLAQVMMADQYRARRFIKADSVVIDAGANIGVFSVMAARLAPQGQVIAFEPLSRTHAILCRNVAHYANVQPVRAALDEKETCEKELVPDGYNAGASTLSDSGMVTGGAAGVREMVPVTSIDSYVQAHSLSRVDFIKIDVEGYEAHVIRGAATTIGKHAPVIAMSAYHKPDDRKNLPRLVRSIDPGYRVRLCRNAEDDLICWKPGVRRADV